MKQVPFEVIRASKESDPGAIDCIFRHFEKYITKRCICEYVDEYGNVVSFLDEDLRNQAEVTLLEAIINFQFKQPPDDFII